MIRAVLLTVAALVTAVSAGRAETPVERGGYLVNTIGVCGNCHSPRGGDPKSFGGGTNVFNTPGYTVTGNNLTPHPEAGIGKFSDAELKVLLTQGKRPNGQQLAPNMPYNVLGITTPGDLDAMVAYLRSLPPLPTAVAPPVYRTEIKPLQPFPPAAKPMTEADLSDPVKRGLYLAAIGHCVACHSRPASVGVDYGPDGFGAGGRKFGPQQTVIAANITSHPTKGIGGWSDGELKAMLTSGNSRDGRKLNAPMVEFAPYYRQMTDADLGALIAWMRSLPPLE